MVKSLNELISLRFTTHYHVKQLWQSPSTEKTKKVQSTDSKNTQTHDPQKPHVARVSGLPVCGRIQFCCTSFFFSAKNNFIALLKVTLGDIIWNTHTWTFHCNWSVEININTNSFTTKSNLKYVVLANTRRIYSAQKRNAQWKSYQP